MARILAIDFGEKRMGLALSDEDQKIAFEYEIWNPQELARDINKLITIKEVEKIILGLPVNMSGEETQKTQEVKAFKENLEKIVSIPIELIDERLSSKMASSIAGTEKNIDSLAAQIFLQNYINKKQN